MPESQIIVKLNPDAPPTGSDLGIVNAARRSFGKRSTMECVDPVKGVYQLREKDQRLLEFLARGMTAKDFESLCDDFDGAISLLDRTDLKELLWKWRNTPTHDTPFNHGFFSFEIKAPIFVRAQLVKHEYLIMSEFSRRYITGDLEFYTPDVWRKAAEDKKQGSTDEPVKMLCLGEDGEQARPLPGLAHNGGGIKQSVEIATSKIEELFEELILSGVAPEQARMILPQSLMTAWTWSGTLGAFANMCKLRCHPEAQYETRLVADKVYKELQKQFPVSAKLLVEGVT